MPSITRRRALYGAVALVTSFAGCSGETSSGSSYPPEDVDNVAIDPESYSLRNPRSEPTVWSGERPTPGEDGTNHYWNHVFVTGPDDAAGVSFADVEGADGAVVVAESSLGALGEDTQVVEATPVDHRREPARDQRESSARQRPLVVLVVLVARVVCVVLAALGDGRGVEVGAGRAVGVDALAAAVSLATGDAGATDGALARLG